MTWLELELTAPNDLSPHLAIALERARLGGWVEVAEEPALQWQFYLPKEPGWEERLKRLDEELTELGGRLTILKDVQDEDWAENWKKFYHPLKIGQRLVVCPSWEDYQAAPGELVMTLDPGSAFGTGYHWSTRLCLELLEELLPTQGVLDLGTGSGILAISAWLLGHRLITALDNDPVAVKVANENLRLNGVEALAALAEGPPDGRFALVLANLVATLHVELASRLAACLAPGGHAILGGIVRERQGEVAEAMERAGLRLEKARCEEEWVALRFVR